MDDNAIVAYIGLGANLGDRRTTLQSAVYVLDEHDRIAVDFDGGIASLYETSPVGGPLNQPNFLNSVIAARCTVSPRELLDILLAIELAHGRTRTQRFAARTLDLDLLLFGGVQSHDIALTLPHPRLHERRFVLEPLAEIAGDVVHPDMNVTINELAVRRRDKQALECVVPIAGRRWTSKPSADEHDLG